MIIHHTRILFVFLGTPNVYTISYYTILRYTILYYTILYYKGLMLIRFLGP